MIPLNQIMTVFSYNKSDKEAWAGALSELKSLPISKWWVEFSPDEGKEAPLHNNFPNLNFKKYRFAKF